MIEGLSQENRELFRRNAVWIVALLAVAASITGIRNGFAYDDVRAIVEDTRFHSIQTIWGVFDHTYWLPKYGASLYRPLTSFGFAIQWIVGGHSPFLFHAVSIALYVAVCVSVYQLARQLFDPAAALIGAAIFAVHPVHVEAVANIVGQAELAAALIAILAVSKYIDWARKRAIGARQVATLSVMYGFALLFKEHVIVLPALIAAAEALAVGGELSTRERIRRIWPLMVSMAIVGAAFVVLRTSVIGSVAGAGDEAGVFLGQPFSVRLLTMLPVVMEWIRLFIWPASLSADYSSPRIDIATSFTAAMLPAIAVLLGVCAIAVRARANHPNAAFAFAWAAITLLIPSNLIVVTGFALAERALFLPSVGVAILLGAAIMAITRRASPAMKRTLVMAVGLVLVAGLARSSYRNPVWKNNETLFRQTTEDIPYSWKSHLMLGELLLARGKGEGILEISLGVKLSPKNDALVRYVAAKEIHLAHQQASALPFYAEALAIDPSNPQIREDAAYCLAQLGRLQEAVDVAEGGLRLKPGEPRLLRFMRFADSTSAATKPVEKAVTSTSGLAKAPTAP